ncbi:hypothetical protein OIU74_006212 [Salix koriyanagi]|uniref:Transcription factor MYC/MYB N-terminal domain-containing protein n=1 Tax=Salix koriyanagi TaxID=2511006 RepID=A0A9Q0ZBC1_9ROSI|nr:hypothetical protein OIU74_006212 [Salix koriyanagi]
MVGSGGADRSKEAVGMMALHEALRSVCLNSDWTYSVFWTIRPRPRVRGGNGCKVGDDNGSLMLMWEDGFCRGRVGDCLEEIDGEDLVRKAFSKMSIQLYNYGEGLMGKVASDKCHKWVFKEPTECEPNISNYWQSSFDALPPEWTDQFESGIQTIAVIQAGHGLLQLGSSKIIHEDLHFQSAIPTHPPPPLFNWSQRLLPSAASLLSSPYSQNPAARLGFPQAKDEPHMFIRPHSSETGVEEMMGEHENDIKWPNGLSFFNALTGRADNAKLLFNPESLGNKRDQNHHSLILEGKGRNPNSDASNMNNSDVMNPNEFLSLDSHPDNARKMENKYKRSFTLPARMTSSSSSTSIDHHQHQPVDYRNPEAGVYSGIMENFLE